MLQTVAAVSWLAQLALHLVVQNESIYWPRSHFLQIVCDFFFNPKHYVEHHKSPGNIRNRRENRPTVKLSFVLLS